MAQYQPDQYQAVDQYQTDQYQTEMTMDGNEFPPPPPPEERTREFPVSQLTPLRRPGAGSHPLESHSHGADVHPLAVAKRAPEAPAQHPLMGLPPMPQAALDASERESLVEAAEAQAVFEVAEAAAVEAPEMGTEEYSDPGESQDDGGGSRDAA